MEQILFAGLLAFLTTLFAIPGIITVSQKINLFDVPDNVRKFHKKPTSSLGGLGIFLGFILSVLFTVNFLQVWEFQFYIACFIIMFFIGIKDDVSNLSPFKKLIAQGIVACILMFKAHLSITDLHGFLGLHHLFPFSAFVVTFLAVVGIINAFNLIDGVDGLAGTLGCMACVLFGSLFLVNGNIPYAVLAFSFSGSLLAFLIFNFQPAKIFMGDTGSLLTGVVISILGIKFMESGSGFSAFPVSAVPAIAFSVLLIPGMDAVRVFGIRITQNRSPFSPDRNHIHHLLHDRGLSNKNITLICLFISLMFVAVAFLLQSLGTTVLIAGLVLSFFGAISLLKMVPVKVSMRVIKGQTNAELKIQKETFPSTSAV